MEKRHEQFHGDFDITVSGMSILNPCCKQIGGTFNLSCSKSTMHPGFCLHISIEWLKCSCPNVHVLVSFWEEFCRNDVTMIFCLAYSDKWNYIPSPGVTKACFGMVIRITWNPLCKNLNTAMPWVQLQSLQDPMSTLCFQASGKRYWIRDDQGDLLDFLVTKN